MLRIMGKNVANNFALIFDNCVLSFIILDFYLSIFIFYVFYFLFRHLTYSRACRFWSIYDME